MYEIDRQTTCKCNHNKSSSSELLKANYIERRDSVYLNHSAGGGGGGHIFKNRKKKIRIS